MSVKNTTATTKTHSLVELLEGRQLFSAVAPESGGEMTPQADAKVAVSDFNFVMKVNKPSPSL